MAFDLEKSLIQARKSLATASDRLEKAAAKTEAAQAKVLAAQARRDKVALADVELQAEVARLKSFLARNGFAAEFDNSTADDESAPQTLAVEGVDSASQFGQVGE